MMSRLFILVLVLWASLAWGHAGGLDALGCHNNSTLGVYECHKGELAGQMFASKAEALAILAPDSVSTGSTALELLAVLRQTLSDLEMALQTAIPAPAPSPEPVLPPGTITVDWAVNHFAWQSYPEPAKITELRLKCGLASGQYSITKDGLLPTSVKVPIRDVLAVPGVYYCIIVAAAGSVESSSSDNELIVRVVKTQ